MRHWTLATCAAAAWLFLPSRASADLYAAAISLRLNPSVRTAGMGDAGTAVFWGTDPNYWANPALLGYVRGAHYEWSRTQLLPSLADDIFFKGTRTTLGAGGIGVGFIGRPSDKVGGARLDYGRNEFPSNAPNAFEDVAAWGIGVSLAELTRNIAGLARSGGPRWTYLGDVSLGYESKKVWGTQYSVGLLPGQLVTIYESKATTRDLGFLARVTPYNSIDHSVPRPHDAEGFAGIGGLRLDVAYGMSILSQKDASFGEDIRTPRSPAPIGRESRQGVSARVRTGFPDPWCDALEQRGAGWVAGILNPLVSIGTTWDRERLSIPSPGGRRESAPIHEVGWEFCVANILTIRGGHVNDPDGQIRGSSSGWGLGMQWRDVAGFRFDRARIPQAAGLPRPLRKGFSCFVDGVALGAAIGGHAASSRQQTGGVEQSGTR